MPDCEATTSGAERLCNDLQAHSLHARRVPASSATESPSTYSPSLLGQDPVRPSLSASNSKHLLDMPDEEKQELPEPKPKPNKDSEKFAEAWLNHPIGYPRLAERMGVRTETMIFRKFSALNSRMLLYMQAELALLEKRLHAAERRDNVDPIGRRSKYATNFFWLLKSTEDSPGTQLALIYQIQKKLQAYNKALIQNAKLHQIAGPDPFDLADIQNHLFSDEMGPGDMVGTDSMFWGYPSSPDAHAPDLIGLCPRETSDAFSRVVAENAVHLFKYGLGRLTRKDHHFGHQVYYDTTVMRITFWITSFLASLLPIGSIIVLIHLETLKAKLWAIAGFNVLISLCLNMFTDASRKDVFAVTAAFAAVQVVFVGTDSQPQSGA